MHTRCPHCDTCFRVTPEHLELAEGAVRCGRCFNTFNARDYLVSSDENQTDENERVIAPPPDKPDSEQPRADTGDTSPIELQTDSEQIPPADTPRQPLEKQEERAEATDSHEKGRDNHHPSDHALELLQEIESRSAEDKRRSARRTIAALLIIALLVLTLIGQYLYANRNTLAQNEDARPWLTMVCAVAGCDVPLLQRPNQIKLIDRDIRSHPEHDNALLVEAEIVNEAPFVQAYPMIKLTLHDITGKVLSGRSFSPSEYLPKGIDQSAGIAPGKHLQIALALVDPGDEAVGFEFDFH